MRPFHRRLVATLLFVGLAPGAALAASVDAVVRGSDGDPVEFAVVYAERVDGNGAPVRSAAPAVIDQVDKAYVPPVTAVMVGTQVSFPNNDPVRHHVYSFSEAKTFEIPLYRGTPRDPIVFDKPGVVTLGCNIHDWMMAHVFVSETPHFAITDASGRVTLDGLPEGDYALYVWHPEMKGEREATRQAVNVPGGAVEFAIEKKLVWRPRRSPARGNSGY